MNYNYQIITPMNIYYKQSMVVACTTAIPLLILLILWTMMKYACSDAVMSNYFASDLNINAVPSGYNFIILIVLVLMYMIPGLIISNKATLRLYKQYILCNKNNIIKKYNLTMPSKIFAINIKKTILFKLRSETYTAHFIITNIIMMIYIIISHNNLSTMIVPILFIVLTYSNISTIIYRKFSYGVLNIIVGLMVMQLHAYSMTIWIIYIMYCNLSIIHIGYCTKNKNLHLVTLVVTKKYLGIIEAMAWNKIIYKYHPEHTTTIHRNKKYIVYKAHDKWSYILNNTFYHDYNVFLSNDVVTYKYSDMTKDFWREFVNISSNVKIDYNLLDIISLHEIQLFNILDIHNSQSINIHLGASLIADASCVILSPFMFQKLSKYQLSKVMEWIDNDNKCYIINSSRVKKLNTTFLEKVSL